MIVVEIEVVEMWLKVEKCQEECFVMVDVEVVDEIVFLVV